ncbi:hypothetical protein BDZ45DRAFT_742491 [Acephala macrosclerotiorum]|nr:hypothetical protein BDZ45DRAFT_742491 [Acephala macrosclerotiorum]
MSFNYFSLAMSYADPFAPVFPSTVADGAMMMAPRRVVPTAEDWERHRPIIKRLYVDESKKLKEVANIMASQYGHNATERMYKARLEKWKFKKNNNEIEMLAIHRIHTKRDRIRKQTTFRVRGQTVSVEQVLHYFSRKKKYREAYSAPTPSDISYRTPSPMPMYTSTDNYIQIVSAEYASQSSPLAGKTFSEIPADNFGATWEDGTSLISTPPFVEDENILQMTLTDMCNLLSPSPSIPCSPSTPQTLLKPERLLLTIKTYVDGSFRNGTWITDKSGYCTTAPSETEEISNAPFDFQEYFLTAISFVKKGMLVEFRRILSKAFNLVKSLVRDKHPRSLDMILGIFLYLKSEGHPEIVEILRQYLSEIAADLLAANHPWACIYQIIGMLEEDSFEQAIFQSWKCTIDGFEKTLGPFHHTSLDMNLNFIYQTNNVLEKEKLVRRLLARYEDYSSIATRQSLRIITELGWNLHDQGRFIEVEELGLDVLVQAETQNLDTKIEALELLGRSKYNQDKRRLAEENQRSVIKIIVDNFGVNDSWAIKNMVILETWLRDWGREMEANELKAQIDEAIGKDMTDEEFNRQ